MIFESHINIIKLFLYVISHRDVKLLNELLEKNINDLLIELYNAQSTTTKL